MMGLVTWMVVPLAMAGGCGSAPEEDSGDADSDVDSDADTDSDGDTDADSDSDSDSDTGSEACATGLEDCDEGPGLDCRDLGTASDCGACGNACLEYEICGDGACVLDPKAHFALEAFDADIAPDDGGAPWDEDGSGPDAILGITLHGPLDAGSWTPVAPDTLSPAWRDRLLGCTAECWLETPLEVRIVDDDDGNGRIDDTDDEIGVCNPEIVEDFLRAGQFTIDACGAATEVRFLLTR